MVCVTLFEMGFLTSDAQRRGIFLTSLSNFVRLVHKITFIHPKKSRLDKQCFIKNREMHINAIDNLRLIPILPINIGLVSWQSIILILIMWNMMLNLVNFFTNP